MFRTETIGDCTLYLGDCMEILPALGKVDAVVTDPPYGVNLGNHGGANDARASHVLIKQGYLNYDDTEENLVNLIVPAVAKSLKITKRGLVFCAGSNVWHFPRADYIGGIYIPAAHGRNKWGFSSFAHCLLYGQAPLLHLGAKTTGIASSATSEESEHPCPKPISWMKWAVNLASIADETVLDPFMGSGTTGVACVKTGRKFIGVEIEPKYFDIACRRIENAYRQPDLFIPQAITLKQTALAL
jgi:DNA modification methylase